MIHANAWKRTFDEYLAQRAVRSSASFVPFDLETDYRRYVDGKPRLAGALSFSPAEVSTCPWGNPAIKRNKGLSTGLPLAKITISVSFWRAKAFRFVPMPELFSRRPAAADCA
jgi:hypothetical protein